MSERCRKTFLFLAYVVFTVGSISYSFYLIWLLAYLTDNGYYWFYAFIPALLVILPLTISAVRVETRFFPVAFFGVILLMMCLFMILTRQAYYHLSADDFIGPEWVINSLKGSIVLVVCGFFIEKECRLQRILESKDILSRGLLDFVDIFNLVQLLSLDQCHGIGSSVTEGSSFELAIQAFCTLSLTIMTYMWDFIHMLRRQNRLHFHINNMYMISVLYQNIPFLIIRIIVWAKYNVFSLGFMVKNILTIVVCCAEVRRNCRSKVNEQNVNEQNEQNAEPNNVNNNPV